MMIAVIIAYAGLQKYTNVLGPVIPLINLATIGAFVFFALTG